MKIGIISLGGKSSRDLAEGCKEFFDDVDELDIRKFKINLDSDGIDIHSSEVRGKLSEYDCLFLRGSYKYALLQRTIASCLRKKVYIPFSSKSFTLAHDKFLTLVELQKNNIPIPKTYFASQKSSAKNILKNKVNYPVIIKAQEGTHGRGVMVADSLKSANTILDMLEEFKKPYIIQEFVKTNGTSDIRAIVCGKRVIASYKRIAAEEDVRSNVHSGGERKKYELSKKEAKIAVKAAKAIGAEICGVDIFHSKHPSIIEVNLSPSLHSVEEITEVDVLKILSKELFLRTLKFKEKREKKLKKKIDNIKNKK